MAEYQLKVMRAEGRGWRGLVPSTLERAKRWNNEVQTGVRSTGTLSRLTEATHQV